jgi:predicted HicB family RNase H-like nuclease
MVKPRGRPPKKKGSTKTRYLQVRVTDREKAAFDAAADLAGLDMSAWVRERLRLLARKELMDGGRQVPFLESK